MLFSIYKKNTYNNYYPRCDRICNLPDVQAQIFYFTEYYEGHIQVYTSITVSTLEQWYFKLYALENNCKCTH